MTFDQQYYKDIWGTVHRHDYAESLANELILKYGKVRFLDIGTGCGYLVKVLREKGCEAYGIEISDYAIEKCCAPGFVVKGDIRDIPFKDNSFDVVHTNGVWGYFPEVDIARAWSECNRVGKEQHHNIDANDEIPEHQYLIKESHEWWTEKLKQPKILVTCPTYDGKAYCFDEWIKMAKSLTYPHYDILVVDNSKTEDFYNKYKTEIPMLHLTFSPEEKDDGMYRVCRSMAEVQKHFLAGNYTHWMNIEADNIPPANVIETLLSYGEADWISHCYATLPGSEGLQQGIGCSLLSRRLMTEFDWSKADDSPDSELWSFAQPMRENKKYKTVELWGLMDVKHLK